MRLPHICVASLNIRNEFHGSFAVGGTCDKSPKTTKGGRSLASKGFDVASGHLKLGNAW